MKEVKYEPCAEFKMHLYRFRQVAKVQLVGDILIFLKPVWHNYIFEYLLHMPAKWGKIENREKHTKKINNFDKPYGFCSHFQRICLFWL